MNCPVCNANLPVKARDLTSGKNDKKYDRAIYNCEDCDTWISVEVPKNGE